ncbi:hypothetical protein CISG_01248 [Coccidioides immitis RMSCC 3703]|uniref:Uncharacterized protein n=1 Tax=Coccidioides immitis RMSCC 3703 TaxID=454286 RepID=A0A0J8QWV3_COCIT|nr:hypothetical protein CISG_01248 [Coccidioides immitis RMSCC 3703]
MLVNLGLTADAAAIHRHEFSAHQSGRSTTPTISQVSNSILSLGFMPSGVRNLVPGNGASRPAPSGRASPSSPLSSPLSSPRDSVEEDCGRTGDDLGNCSEADQSVPTSPRRKHTNRSKTSFRFAHPPPSGHRRLRIRPRLLLQLQHVSQTSRPISALDVIPSSLFGTRSTRRVSNPHRGRDRIGPNDLLIIPSDSYSPLDNEQRNSFDVHGELVAVLGQSRKEGSKSKGLVDICIDQGGLWEATPISNNVYEFTHTGENGLRKCVRWVLRGKENRNSMGLGAGGEQDGKRYIFSMIDPTSRRHPVIAWMTRNGIDVLDRYSLTSGSTRSRSASISAPSSNAKLSTPVSDRNVTETEDWLRTLIIVTGIWVALREGVVEVPGFIGYKTHHTALSEQGLKSIDSEKPAPRKVSKERRRKRHRILCMGSETSSPPDSPHPPGIPSRGTPGRPRGRHQGLLDAGLTEYDDQDAGHPSHVSHSPRKSDSAKRRKCVRFLPSQPPTPSYLGNSFYVARSSLFDYTRTLVHVSDSPPSSHVSIGNAICNDDGQCPCDVLSPRRLEPDASSEG